MEQTTRREDNLIATGVEFVRAMAEVHGAERGMELYESIADVLGADIKGKIFMAMLLGTHHSSIELTLPSNPTNLGPVPIIKSIRTHAYLEHGGTMGLKEAKDLYDKMKAGSKIRFAIASGAGVFAKVAAEFKAHDCIVH